MKSTKVVKREICNMVSKGTFKDSNNHSYEPKYVLAFKKNRQSLGITYFDLATLKIYTGEFEDDEHFSMFRTLVC